MSNFDKIIGEKASSHEAAVPSDAWANINKTRKKRRFGFFWLIGCALLAGLLSIWLMRNDPKPGSLAGNDQIIPNEASSVSSSAKDSKIVNNTQTSLDEQAPASKASPVGADFIEDKEDSNGSQQLDKRVSSKTDTPSAGKKLYSASESQQNVLNNDITANNRKRNVRSNSKARINMVASEADGEQVSNEKRRLVKQKSTIKVEDAELETTASSFDRTTEIDSPQTAKLNPSSSEPDRTTAVNPSPEAIAAEAKRPDSISKKEVASVNKSTQPTQPKPKKSTKGWFIDLTVAPVVAMQKFDRNTTFSRTTNISAMERTVFNGTLGDTKVDPTISFYVGVRKSLNKRIQLGAGFRFLELKESISISGMETKTRYEIIRRLVHNGGAAELANDTVLFISEGKRDIKAVNSYRFLSVPVFARYYIKTSSRWSLSADLGVVIDIYQKYENEINKAGSEMLSSSSNKAERKLNLGYSLGFAISRSISKRIYVFAQPSFYWCPAQAVLKNALLNKKMQQVQVGFGVSYTLTGK